ncbi:L-ribulose-5-phosphate 4-epimerase AraD [Lentisphaera profundi]|uniref:L-ribulose-5-phosphate 4-epimerase n=1 Tax=Lentisphaera profundi TaxID=1658616 RepID=A0ABY7W5A1_9BACT|nr:L-ribulose-5-phosphate 4-epimerase AraD [Lentisphaera profundi]WDE99433.1 L-ribulose-5-phosphate 4-epimerase AraD [Lentisphaera profundi]
MLEQLKEEVLQANKLLQSSGLVKLTWGNVSGIDRERGLVVIKASGVSYEKMGLDDLVVLDLQGNIIEGELNPSSDSATHLHLYREFTSLGGICHTHSLFATTLCQNGRELPCSGTTHADHFCGTVPLARALNESEVQGDYELNTGKVIVETFVEKGLNPMEVPAVLLHYHAPFTWGESPMESFKNSVALESCAEMAVRSLQATELPLIPAHILEKHYQRKHGKDAYYGQKK